MLAFGVLFLVAFFVYRSLFVAGTSQGVQYVAQAAENGTLVVSVSGTGNAALGSSYDVTPSVSGVVRELSVKVGDTVTEGQVLFTLENDQLDMNVISAQASYDQARASLLNAEANVYQSEQSLDQLENAADGGSSSAVTTTPITRPPSTGPPVTFPSTTSTTSPPVGTTSTSSPPTTAPPTTTTLPPTTNTTQPPVTTTTGMSPPTSDASAMQAAAMVSALGTAAGETATPVAALSTPESGDTSATTAQASNTVTDTDITVAGKKLAAAEASLASAQGNLQTAEYNLEQARIDAASRTVTAPADGVITQLNVAEGASLGSTSTGTSGGASGTSGAAADSAGSSSGAALTIVDPHSISAVVQLMESDIPQIEVGQKATLTFDAVPDLTLTGKVTAMDLIGTNTQGVVTFNVTVTPDSRDDRIRAGMTSYASIVTAVRQDVVLVPSGAVKTGTSGGSYVEVLVNGVPEQRDVTIGLSGDTQIEIASGLRAGDEVVTQTIDPNTTATTTGSGGGFGIGGAFPGAGGPGR